MIQVNINFIPIQTAYAHVIYIYNTNHKHAVMYVFKVVPFLISAWYNMLLHSV